MKGRTMQNSTVTIPFPISRETTDAIIADFVAMNRWDLVPTLILAEIGRTNDYGRRIAFIPAPINATLEIVQDESRCRKIYFQIQNKQQRNGDED